MKGKKRKTERKKKTNAKGKTAIEKREGASFRQERKKRDSKNNGERGRK